MLDSRKPVDEGEALRKRCGTAVRGQRRKNPVEGVLVERRQKIVAQRCVIFIFERISRRSRYLAKQGQVAVPVERTGQDACPPDRAEDRA